MEYGYPSAEDLHTILAWNFREKPIENFLSFLESIWWRQEWGFKLTSNKRKTKYKLELHTGGWSGNEDLIDTLMQMNFWHLCWRMSKRGGHYYFEINVKLFNENGNNKKSLTGY